MSSTINVLSNDTDAGGTLVPQSVQIVAQPQHGTASVHSIDGSIDYTPTSEYFGPDQFSYTVKDNLGATSNVAIVSLTVLAPPNAANDSASTGAGAAVQINVLSNDTDADGVLNASTVQIVGSPAHGNASVDPLTGIVTYTPASGFVGSDQFTYTVKDSSGLTSNIATVSITVVGGPIAVDDTAVVTGNQGGAITVLTNDTPVGSPINPATVQITTPPQHGTASANPQTGAIIYTPASNYFGPDQFFYTVSDAGGVVSNAAKVSVTVNHAPVANDETFSTAQGEAATIAVLANDTDPDGTIDPPSVQIVSHPQHGSTSINPQTGDVTYTPDAAFFGTDVFTYAVKDNLGAVSNVATVTGFVDGRPVANDDNATTCQNESVDIDVLANDTDPDSLLNAGSVLVGAAQHGTLSVNPANGVVTYTPALDYTGPDQFTYTVKDTAGTISNSATVSLTVVPAPEVLSIVPGGPNPTNAGQVQFTVTFSEGVSGVDTTDFALATTGGISGASIVSVSPIQSSTSLYSVTVNTGSGDGTLGLNLVDDDSIIDASQMPLGCDGPGNGNFTGTPPFTIDRSPPVVLSISPADPNPTNASVVHYSVTFNEDVTGVDVSDFSLVENGALSGSSISDVTGSGNTRTVTVSVGSGQGTLGLNLNDDDSISDLAGNLLGGAGAGNGDFVGTPPYTIDLQPPIVMSIVLANSNPTGAASVQWTVTFSEDVLNVDPSDFHLATTGSLDAPQITNITNVNNVYTVTATTGVGDGTLGLNVADDDSIVDAAGNPLGGSGTGNGDFVGEVYTVDKAPFVVSLTRADPSPTNAANVNWTVTFSEDVSGVDTSDFGTVESGGVSGSSVTNINGSGSVYTVTASTGSGQGGLGLNLFDDDTIMDGTGQSLVGNGTADGSFTGEVYSLTGPAPPPPPGPAPTPDVNRDGAVSSLDALLVINSLIAPAQAQALSLAAPQANPLDVNHDAQVTSLDALIVINQLVSAQLQSQSAARSVDSSSAASFDRSAALAAAAVAHDASPALGSSDTQDDELEQTLNLLLGAADDLSANPSASKAHISR